MGRYREVETIQDSRSYDARIWWAFWAVALIVLIYTAWHQIREYDLVHNGNSIVAEYYIYNEQELARYLDENNRYHSYNVSGLNAIHEEDTITLYYKTSIDAAEPHRHPKTWIYSYIIFGIALVLCSLKIYKIYTEDREVYDVREFTDMRNY